MITKQEYSVGQKMTVIGLCWLITFAGFSIFLSGQKHLKQREKESSAQPVAQSEREFPQEARDLEKEILQKDTILREVINRIMADKVVNEEIKSKIGNICVQARIEGLMNGTEAYTIGIIGEEQLVEQLKKANQLMQEAIDEAKKADEDKKAE